MHIEDIMTRQVVGIVPSESIAQAARLMVDHRISGLPVVDAAYHVVGMITEGDLLRRSELGTEAKRSQWQSFFASSGKLADEYTHSHGRKVEEVMSPAPVTIGGAALLGEAVETMLKHHVRRLPVISAEGELVGIISRSDIVRALLGAMPQATTATTDEQIGEAIVAELKQQEWAGMDNIRVGVRDGVVKLDGAIFDDRQRVALKVAAENAPGVRRVVDDLVWIEPTSGLVMTPPDEHSAAIEGDKAA